jgi:squalene-hopene/tetraprenyl-beta-curcumene cyclase
VILVATAASASASRAEEPVTLANVQAPPPLTADEPFAAAFSLHRAARSLDSSALYWQKTRHCAACHTIPPYLLARPVLAPVVPEPAGVRRFVEGIVINRTEAEPSLPRDGIAAVLVSTATALAFHDRQTTGKLHPVTRQALDRIWTVQRPDGSWEWPYRDVPPIKLDEHYGVTFAALGVGLAPGGYARTEAARRGIEGVRRFLKAHPPSDLHQKAMLLWAALHVDGLLSEEGRAGTLQELLAMQRPDGGWSLASLVDDAQSPGAQTEQARKLRGERGYGTAFLVYAGRRQAYKSALASDGYATGFAVYVARQAGVPAQDPRLQRGLAWLKSHQRASGRWFTPSQGNHEKNYVSNAGTAYAVLALHACGEVPERSPVKHSP